MYVCLSVCLSVSLSVCMSVCLSDCMYVCLSVYLTVCMFTYVCHLVRFGIYNESTCIHQLGQLACVHDAVNNV